jgi:hypothetical protein
MSTAEEPSSERRWRPVREQAADSLWLVMIVAMSLTVLGTRVFLELTGYPQIGDSEFHIAHVLWGGLLLFVAVALPLSLVNRYALWAAAAIGGIGAGLFIDEVGKFITQSNDYFAPLAFPIIYGFVLACVWLFYRIRRHQPRDTRTLLYHALEDMKQVLDRDLDPFEHRELVAELEEVAAKASDPNERLLGQALLDYVRSRDVRFALAPNPLERALIAVRDTFADWPPRLALKAILVIGFGLLGGGALFRLGALVSLVAEEGPLSDALDAAIIVSGKSEYTIANPTILTLASVAVVGVGLLALVAAVLLLIGRERTALRIGVFGLVVALTIVEPLTFYFSQLYAVLDAGGQVFLLCVAALYRWRFLSTGTAGVPIGAAAATPPPA